MKKILVVPAIPHIDWDITNQYPTTMYYTQMEHEELIKVANALKAKYPETDIIVDGSDWYGICWQTLDGDDVVEDDMQGMLIDDNGLIWLTEVDIYADGMLVVAYSDLLKVLNIQPKETMRIEDLLKESKLDLDKVLEGNTEG